MVGHFLCHTDVRLLLFPLYEAYLARRCPPYPWRVEGGGGGGGRRGGVGGVGGGGGGEGWGGEGGGGAPGGKPGGGRVGKAVHTQGGAHKGGAHRRLSVATTGVLSLKGVRGLAPSSSVASRSPVHYRMPPSFTR